MSKRAVIYARVSTDDQAERGYSLPTQLEAMREYVARLGWAVAAEITDDYTGAKLDRPGLDRVRALVEQGAADALIVYSADRLSRNLAQSIILREELKRAGVELHTVDRGQSQDTPEGTLLQNIEATIAEYEREKIKERMRRGKRGKAQSGRWAGTRPPYGYSKIGQGRDARLEINPTEAAVVRRIFSLYLGLGDERPLTMLHIAVKLTAEKIAIPGRGRRNANPAWRDSTVRYILTNPAYIGEFICMGQVVRLPELALIDRAVFDAAEKRRKKNARRISREPKFPYLLGGGYLFCTCGKRMIGDTVYSGGRGKGQRYHYYTCVNSQRRYLDPCREARVRALDVEAVAWNWIAGLLTDEANLDAGIRRLAEQREIELSPQRARLEIVNKLLSDYDARIKRLAKAFAEAESDVAAAALEGELKAISRQRSDLADEQTVILALLEQEELTAADQAAIRKIAADLRDEIADVDADPETKRFLLERLQVRLQLRGDDKGRWLEATCSIKTQPECLPVARTCSKPAMTFGLFRNSSATRT